MIPLSPLIVDSRVFSTMRTGTLRNSSRRVRFHSARLRSLRLQSDRHRERRERSGSGLCAKDVDEGGLRVVGESLETEQWVLDIGSNAPLLEAVSGTSMKSRTGSKITRKYPESAPWSGEGWGDGIYEECGFGGEDNCRVRKPVSRIQMI